MMLVSLVLTAVLVVLTALLVVLTAVLVVLGLPVAATARKRPADGTGAPSQPSDTGSG